MAANRERFTMIFDSFVASAGSGIPVTESRKNCQVNVNLHVPAGSAVAAVSYAQRGYVQLPAGVQAQASGALYVGGESAGSQEANFVGPVAKDYLETFSWPTLDFDTGNCQADRVVPLNANTQVRVDGPASASAQITADSLDGKVDTLPAGTAAELTVVLADCPGPAITASATTAGGAPYVAGTVTNQPVTVAFTCTSTGAPVATCTEPVTYSTDGTFSATGTVTDTEGHTVTTTFGPNVVDRTAPACSATTTPSVLRPPNGKIVPVSVTVTAADGTTATLVSLTSNEGGVAADQQGFTAGSSLALDAGGQATFAGGLRATRNGAGTGGLRATRSGAGTGRVYTFTVAVADSAANVGQCEATVAVPHDQRT